MPFGFNHETPRAKKQVIAGKSNHGLLFMAIRWQDVHS
jgi:hypothetical protein